MHVRTIVGIAAGLTLLIGGTFALLRLLQGRELAPNQGIAGPPTETVASVSDQQPESSHSEIILPPKLPETAPPADVPITEANRRDAFPVIREPWYVSAQEGDNLLAQDEPVLGLVLAGKALVYSTNQLNEHEMVIDQIGDVPILVTY